MGILSLKYKLCEFFIALDKPIGLGYNEKEADFSEQ